MDEPSPSTPAASYQPVAGGYGTSPGYAIDNKPLFGESRQRDRIVNLVVGVFTALMVIITLISAFAEPRPPKAMNIYFGICILLILVSHLVLIYWYRQGDVDPKFRNLIYYNALTIVLLSVCALVFIFHNH